jgi:cyclopropane-fatty-acyl-phospholipid synthase
MNIPHQLLESKSAKKPLLPYKRIIFKHLQKCHHGGLFITDGHDHQYFGDLESKEVANLTILHPNAYRYIFWFGSIGAAEAYIKGWWTSSDITQTIRFFIKNIDFVNALESRQNWFLKPFAKLFEWVKKNNKEGSAKNIHAHYDLSNEFFSSFLDPTKNYSSAIYTDEHNGLEDAQYHKMKVICEKLDLVPSDHVLEIGTGWGGMSLYMAENYGCRVTTTTISNEQFQYTQKLIKERRLDHLVEVKKNRLP